jgi:hypothetical protein
MLKPLIKPEGSVQNVSIPIGLSSCVLISWNLFNMAYGTYLERSVMCDFTRGPTNSGTRLLTYCLNKCTQKPGLTIPLMLL